MRASEILRKAKGLPRTQRAFARTAEGNTVDLEHEKACSFCAAGAIMRTAHDVNTSPEHSMHVMSRACLAITGKSAIIHTNDNAEPHILDWCWDKAIELAEREEAGAP